MRERERKRKKEREKAIREGGVGKSRKSKYQFWSDRVKSSSADGTDVAIVGPCGVAFQTK